ncbi:MAG: hypothetical protein HC912_11610 [Saprospiraceae bacterium]|nr:hypothetical protein [Saprospiraceae bacterium]
MWRITIHPTPPDNDDHGDSFKALSSLGHLKTRNLVLLYERYGVDFAFFGHTHLYERTWPLKDNRINMKEGVVYVNSGGAGGGIENFAPTRNWFTLELEAVHHFCTFAIYDKHLVFKAVDHEGKMLDAFQMEKTHNEQRRASIVQPPAPQIATGANLFEQSTTVSLNAAFDSLDIHYTLDGSEPTRQSPRYTAPFNIEQSTTLQARAYTRDGRASRIQTLAFRQMSPQAPSSVKKTTSGLRYAYYEGEWQQLPNFEQLTALRTGVVQQLALTQIEHRPEHFGLVLEGYVDIAETGITTFFLNSDDGSKLYINDELIIDYDGDHSAMKKTGQTILQAGKHKLRIEYYQGSGGSFLQAGMVDLALGDVPFTPFQVGYE